MTKKSRRDRRSGQKPRLSAAQMVRPEVGAAPTAVASVAQSPADPASTDLNSEYVYVISDLKRIGVIAAAMIAVLVVLAIVLT